MNDPNTWRIPSWHPDFGDPVAEVEMLREFAISAIKALPKLTATLCTPEEGYLYVDILRSGQKVAEVYVILEGDKRRFAVFGFDGNAETEEHYFSEYSQGIEILDKLMKKKR